MREIKYNIYKFKELSKEAKQIAIETQRNAFYINNDFAEWTIDDDYLFEPKHQELISLFGKDFYKILNKNKKYKDLPLIGNNKECVYFDCDAIYRHLDCTKAIDINNDYYFLLWLGIPKNMLDNVEYKIYTSSDRYANTKIAFTPYELDAEFTVEQETILKNAKEKFDNHISDILSKITDSIESQFSDENIIDYIENYDFEYTENGQLFKLNNYGEI